MQQFVVPQFIDVEDKIIGPVTTRQFLEMMVVLFAIVGSYSIADFSLFLFLAAIEFFIGGVFAFLRVNGRPFHDFLVNILQTLKRPSIRVWKKSALEAVGTVHDVTIIKKKEDPFLAQKLATFSHADRHHTTTLRELALTVDSAGQYHVEEEV